jgi:prophage antirepressor-like protein
MENNKIQIFENQRFGKIRAIEIEGEPYFIASDVAKSLGYTDSKQAVVMHCKSGEVLKQHIAYIPHSNGVGGTKMVAINEPNVYRLVMRSHLPKAEEFQDWVCGEVLPAIRKTGQYSIKPLTPAEMFLEQAKLYLEQEKRITHIEAKVDSIEARINELEKPLCIWVPSTKHLMNCEWVTCGGYYVDDDGNEYRDSTKVRVR